MGTQLCFKHRKKDCECIVPQGAQGFSPSLRLLSKKSAFEIFYSCKAFAQNVVYSPDVVAMLAQQYLTIADEVARAVSGTIGTEERARVLISLKERLKEAGWNDAKGEAAQAVRGPSDSGTDS